MLGVFGGTFNPVHYGHLRSALEVKEFFQLEQLRLIPCRIPAHRQEPDVSAEMRLHLLQLAIKDMPGWLADRRELDRDGPSYMVDTLASLKAEFADSPILLFIGTDAFAGLTNWYQWQHLFDLAHVVVMTRPGFQPAEVSPWLQQRQTEQLESLRQRQAGLLYFFPVTQLDISASRIRKLVAAGLDTRFLLPDGIIQEINKHHLYQTSGN